LIDLNAIYFGSILPKNEFRGTAVRITDDRYHRERQQMDLAMRMIRHEARTATIQAWTGLSGDRVRKLHREYGDEYGEPVRRRRGKPPRQSAYFLRNADVRRQAIALGGLYALLGLLSVGTLDRPSGFVLPPWSGLFCEAYETYLTLDIGSGISFEHAFFLLEALHRQIELQPGRCPTCAAFTIVDTQRRGAPQCPLCDVGRTSRDRLRDSLPPTSPPLSRARIP
jgi:hypothetical protein